MIKKGIYAASLSVLNENGTLNINETILHAESAIRSGLHGVFFFGSTGQSQLISINEKKEFIAKIASHKLRKQFFLGTGCNSLNDNIDLVKYAMEYDFRDIYASVLKDWFVVPSATIQSMFEHSVQFYPLVGACNVGIEEHELSIDQALLYPNPCNTNSTVRFNSAGEWVKINIFEIGGKHVQEIYDGNLPQGQHDIFMEINELNQGEYVVQILKESGDIQTKLIKRR